MKHTLRQVVLVMCAVGATLVSAGCQTLQPEGIHTASLENHGGGGGDH